MTRVVAALLLGMALLLAPAAARAGEEPCRTLRGLVVLVEFEDTPHRVVRADVEKRFFHDLADYVRQMSYGAICLGGEVTRDWVRLPAVSELRIAPHNLLVDKSRLGALLRNVFQRLPEDYDPSAYDFIAFYLGARQVEYGMIGLCAYPGMLGWQAERQLRLKNGKPIKGVAIFSHEAHLGTLFHDIAHVIGGLTPDGRRAVPCLYDHDLQARPGPLRQTFAQAVINMGYWDPMSSHYNDWDAPPPGISSWTKARLGWLPEDKLAVVGPGETREILLGPLDDGRSETLAIRVPLSPTRYYMIENRRRVGYDAALPGQGVLIMRADDAIGECRHGEAPVKLVDANPLAPTLNGAAFDIGRRALFEDPEAGVGVELLEKVGASYRIRVTVR